MYKNPFLSILHALAEISARRVEKFGAQYQTFGIFGFLNYPFSFLILYYIEHQQNESLTLRLIASGLCLLLILRKYWPSRLVKYLPLYWQLTLTYCLPFLGSLMMMRNGFSKEWLMNLVQGLFLFVLLVDWGSFIALMILGIVLGTLVFLATGGHLDFDLGSVFSMPWPSFAYMYVYAIVMGIIFGRNREKINEAKLQTVKSLAYSIAHEMRTPLASITAGASNLGKYLPIYQEAYIKASKAGIVEAKIHPNYLERIKDIPATMEKVSYNAQIIINMLLMKVKEIPVTNLDECSLSRCLTLAIEQYPLKDEEREKIIIDLSHDFNFLGKEEIFVHVLFNLIKNGIYQISLVSAGVINIYSRETLSENILHFKDNGKGISKRILSDIFDRFVTGTEFGTGMGLSYCKMVMNSFGGNIECVSVEGQGAEFILTFPKITYSPIYETAPTTF
jgi:signal transduction histidine kinase